MVEPWRRAVRRLPFFVSTLGRATGEPAIVVPGGPCRGPEYLGDLAGLGDDRALTVLHPRGTRRTGGLSRGWWADAADVVLLADALGLESVDLVAHSAGTRLALSAAAQFPHRIRSVALITPPATWLTGTDTDVSSLAASLPDRNRADAFTALSEQDPTTESDYRELFARQAPASYAHWTHLEQAHAAVGAVSLAAASAWFTDIPEDAIRRIREAIPARALVVGGDRDLLTGVQPVRDYAAVLSADLEMLADCGHYPWVEQPARFRELLSRWLAPGNG